MADIFIGVDPGASGGMASISDTVGATAMPGTDADIWAWFSNADFAPYNTGRPAAFAVIEKVQGYAGSPTVGSAMFKFGASYGGLRMALTAAGIPFEEATPQVWQRGLKIPQRTKAESKTAWKNRLKAAAQRLFPGIKVTLATADALLIAEYCRRKRGGTL